MDIIETDFANYDKIKRHPWEISRCRFVRRQLRRCFSGKERLKILDIGSGDCYFLEKLASQYPEYEFTAIDIGLNDNQINLLRTRLPANVISILNRWESLPQDKQFDAIIMLDVLEHIEDDVAFIQKIKTSPMLRDGGIVLLTVPALPFLFSHHDHVFKHYRRYYLHDLNLKFRQTGLHLQHSSYFFASLMPIRFFGKILSNRQNQNMEIKKWNGKRRLTSLISLLLYYDAMTCSFLSKFKIHTPGLSCLLIGRK